MARFPEQPRPSGVGGEVFMRQSYCAAIRRGRIDAARHVIPAPEPGFARDRAEAQKSGTGPQVENFGLFDRGIREIPSVDSANIIVLNFMNFRMQGSC